MANSLGPVRQPAMIGRRRIVGLKFWQGESSGRKREEKERESGLLTPLTRSTPLKPKPTNKTPQKYYPIKKITFLLAKIYHIYGRPIFPLRIILLK